MFGILQLAALFNIVTAQQKKYYKPVPDIAKLLWTGSGPRTAHAPATCPCTAPAHAPAPAHGNGSSFYDFFPVGESLLYW